MFLQFDVAGLANLASVLNAMALLMALSGAWLLLATRWRQQLAAKVLRPADTACPAINLSRAQADVRINRFFYRVGFASLALAWLLSTGIASI